MKLTVVNYNDLLGNDKTAAHQQLESALLQQGIVGIRGVPGYENAAQTYIETARAFCALPENIKAQYTPVRSEGYTEGYELGAEKFINAQGQWQLDDKKASYYAFVPDSTTKNKWPKEIDLRTPYLALGDLILNTGKIVLNALGLNESTRLDHNKITGYGRMLHYVKEGDATFVNPDWCGGHFDHSLITGLLPAYYYRDGQLVDEPSEAGLYIKLGNNDYERINADDKSLLLFQVGEFGQLLSNDRIRATQHIVKKARGDIERFTFALFFNPDAEMTIQPSSVLTRDPRYMKAKKADNSLNFTDWDRTTVEYFHAK